MNNVTVKGPLIDGFAIECCGDEKRVVTIKNDLYTIGYWKGIYEEAVEAISKKYTGGSKDVCIAKLQDAKDMKWLTDELCKQLVSHEDHHVRAAVAKYSDKYHHILKDDEHWLVRLAVAEYTDRYHEQFRDDDDWYVRLAVAKYSNKYHEQLKDDPDEDVRKSIAEYSDKYHGYLKDDTSDKVRLAIANYKKGE